MAILYFLPSHTYRNFNIVHFIGAHNETNAAYVLDGLQTALDKDAMGIGNFRAQSVRNNVVWPTAFQIDEAISLLLAAQQDGFLLWRQHDVTFKLTTELFDMLIMIAGIYAGD